MNRTQPNKANSLSIGNVLITEFFSNKGSHGHGTFAYDTENVITENGSKSNNVETERRDMYATHVSGL